MQLKSRILYGLFLACALLSAQADPPGRVARMSYQYGSVSFRPGDVDDWFPADFNRPLTTGDHVFVDLSGTVELQLGSAVLLLGSRTTMDILNLDDSNAQLRMSEGTLVIRVRSLGDQDSFEVDTPNLAFSISRTGEYRIEVKPDFSTTLVAVRAGEGELNGPDQAFTVHAGEQVQVAGADQPSYQTAGVSPRDTLENFSLQRQQREEQSMSARYCSHEMVGYEDLDRFGSWRNTPDYGMVWTPNGMPVGWAPYHNGHWVWVDPWGWTWVDDAPWGFAPAHYGRWAYTEGFWAWVPGPVAERPVYAPALVAFVGGGAVGDGVAWFPLGPREVYVPAYRTTPAYVNRINVTNTVLVNNITNVNVTNVTYVNRGAPNAVMAVQHEAFAGARPVQNAAIVVRPEIARSAPVVATASVAPTRASVVRIAAPGANVARPPVSNETRPVIARRAPPPPPVPFVQKQAALAANAGRPLEPNQVQQLRQAQPPAARPLVRQVPARAPAAQAPAGPSNRPPVQVPPQRTSTPPAVVQPPSAPQRTATPIPPPAQNPPARPAPTQPAQPAPVLRPAQPPAPREAQPPAPREAQPPPPREAQPPAQAPSARPAPARAAPPPGAEKRPAPKNDKPAAKDEEDKKKNEKQ